MTFSIRATHKNHAGRRRSRAVPTRHHPGQNPAGVHAPAMIEKRSTAVIRSKDRRWEKEHYSSKAVYRGVDPHLALRVRAIAEKLCLPAGDVARTLLEYGLRAQAEGDLIR